MKTITIYKREVLKKTGFRKYPFRQVTEVIINYDGKEFKNDHWEDIANPRLKIKFTKALETRSIKNLNKYVSRLGRSDSDKFEKATINRILSEVEE